MTATVIAGNDLAVCSKSNIEMPLLLPDPDFDTGRCLGMMGFINLETISVFFNSHGNNPTRPGQWWVLRLIAPPISS